MNFIEWIINLAQISLWMTAIVFIGIYILKPLVMFIPLPVLYVAAGIVFPTRIALVITFGGVALALISGYFTGKLVGAQKFDEYLIKNEKISYFLGDQDKRFLSLCFIYRVLPLPFDLFNMLCGAAKVPFWKYLIVSLLGLSFAVVFNIVAGVNIATPLTLKFLIPFSVSLCFSCSMFFLYKRRI